MRDLGLFFSLASLAGLALWRPWLGVLAMAFFGYLQPHSYAEGFMQQFPVYKTLFAATFAGTLFTRDRQLPPRDWRVLFLAALWVYVFFTTNLALLKFAAWPQFFQFSGVLASSFLILILINTREKLFWLIVVTALSFGLVIIKGGYWAIIHGFSDRVYGPPGSQYGDNNHFAVAAVMAIPLLALWFRNSTDRWVKVALAIFIALGVLAVLSSWSRGGLLALGATSVLLLSGGRKGALAIAAAAGAAFFALTFLPDDWFARMETISTYQTDGSAQGRLDMWWLGLGYALHHPLAGAGFNNWYAVTGVRDWHSAYVEVMAEHGLVAFSLWLSLILGTLVGLIRLTWLYRRRAESAWITDYARALAASLVGYCVGGAFLGIAYWDLLYHIVAMCILLAFFAEKPFPPVETS